MQNANTKNKKRKRVFTQSKNGANASKKHKSNGFNQSKRFSPEKLIGKVKNASSSSPLGKENFENIPIDSRLRENISRKGYTLMTEIQEISMNHLLDGLDLVGIANTGTGKTGAFLIPIIHRMITEVTKIKVMVLVPTRELALQVQEEFESLTRGLGLISITLIGGSNVNIDIQKLRKGFDLIIGTPGRTTDMIERRSLLPEHVSVLVLDEFDRMLDMGFSKEVMRIAKNMKNRSQTVLFSATENENLRPLINELLENPVYVSSTMQTTTSENVDQDIIRIQSGQEKFTVLLDLIVQDEFRKVLIFSETKRGVSKLTKKLKAKGFGVDEIHGNRSQAQRKKALDLFRKGGIQVLTATDVAARGLDIEDVSHVINYQLPGSMDSYIHRIGRTGRAGKTGHAITFMN